VIDTNLFGYIYGARAVMPYFREQNSGILINVASQVALGGTPYISAYVASKFAIRGWSECLREELLGSDIHVCTVLPASIDTPLFQQAANYTGRAIKPLSPVLSPYQVADAIVRLSQSPKREVLVGQGGRIISVAHAIAPGLYERGAARKIEKDHFLDATATDTPGNLSKPMNQWP